MLRVSRLLTETAELLDEAEALNVIPNECEYRTELMKYDDPCAFWHHRTDRGRCSLQDRFAHMRTEYQNTQGFFQQLWLFFRLMTPRLYVLSWRLEAISQDVEVR